MIINKVKTRKASLTGNVVRVTFSTLLIDLKFESKKLITFSIIEGAGIIPNGYVETVKTNIIEIRAGIFFLGWKEVSGSTVTHLEDYRKEILYTHVTLHNHTFINLKGSIKPQIPIQGLRKVSIKDTGVKDKRLTGIKLFMNIGNYLSELYFISDTALYIKPIKGNLFRSSELPVHPNINEILPNVYLVSWQTENKITIVILLDVSKRKIYCKITLQNGTFLCYQGTTKLIR